MAQISAQAPADATVGPVAITVTNTAGTSNTFTAQRAAVAPGMLAPASFKIGGKQYLVALFPEGFYVGNADLIPGVAFRPAKPGDTITAYGIGFGDVTPAIAPGVIVSQLNQLANSFSVQFGQTQANVTYFGLSPNYIGLYEFDMTVPDVSDGDQQINVTLGARRCRRCCF